MGLPHSSIIYINTKVVLLAGSQSTRHLLAFLLGHVLYAHFFVVLSPLSMLQGLFYFFLGYSLLGKKIL